MDHSKLKQFSDITLKKAFADTVFKSSTFLNVFSDEWIQADIAVQNGYIVGIGSYQGKNEIDCKGKYFVPGFFDAHLHVESSMARPSTFFQLANQSGTTSFIIDPHEAANVKGIYGIEYMIEEARQVNSNVFVMAPSCVPATKLDDSGAILDAYELSKLLKYPEVIGLGEVMDYYAVENFEKSMVEKLELFSNYIKDGHAAGFTIVN